MDRTGRVLTAIALALALSSCGAGQRRARPHVPASAPAAAPVVVPVVNGAAPRVAGDRAIARTLAYTDYISVGRRQRKDVALTFDDGPSPYTRRIVAILRRRHAPATFFEIGRQARALPQIERSVLRAGVPVGDHTQNHPLLSRLHLDQQRAEIAQGADSVRAGGAPEPRLFRPPYGGFDRATLRAVHARRMLMVLWSVDTRDFLQPGVDRIVRTALSGARAGAIILMHDGGGARDQTVAALPQIITHLRRRGYHLVTVPRLLIDDPPRRGQPAPRSLSGLR